jgi:hypothetical protein
MTISFYTCQDIYCERSLAYSNIIRELISNSSISGKSVTSYESLCRLSTIAFKSDGPSPPAVGILLQIMQDEYERSL